MSRSDLQLSRTLKTKVQKDSLITSGLFGIPRAGFIALYKTFTLDSLPDVAAVSVAFSSFPQKWCDNELLVLSKASSHTLLLCRRQTWCFINTHVHAGLMLYFSQTLSYK